MAAPAFFNKFKPIKDSTEQLRSHLRWYLFIRVILFTLLISIPIMLLASDRQIILPSSPVITFFLLFIYSYSILSSFIIKKKKKHLKRFGLIQILSDTVFIALLVYATGSSQSIFTPVFILPILAGGLIMYRIGGLIPAAASTILYGICLTLEYFKIIPAYYGNYQYIEIYKYEVSTSIFAVYGLTFFLIALLSGLLAKKVRTAEDALSFTEMKLDRLALLHKQIFDDISTGIITLDPSGFITSCNPAAANITGYPAEEVTGKKFNTFFPNIPSQKHERHASDFTKKDGKHIRIGHSCSELHMASNNHIDDPSISSNRVITLQDISTIEKMEKQVRDAEKMAAIGELSASIAHDFRNPLAAIFGSAQILAMDSEDSPTNNFSTQKNLTDIILRESNRMAETITNFLHYAQPLNLETSPIKLKEVVQQAIEQLAIEQPICDKKEIKNNISKDLEVQIDTEMMQVAMTHILKNSCHATSEQTGPITCSARIDNSKKPLEIIIDIEDKGAGIDQSIQEKIFEPFFTTREDTAGLGLAIVKQIIEGHGGTVEISSQLKNGCKISLRLPQKNPTH